MEKRENMTTIEGNPLTLLGPEIKVGDSAPDFTVVDNQLQVQKLSLYNDKIKIISVVPSLDTGVCAAQTRRFNEEATQLENVVILTISVDLPFAQKRFCAAEGIDKVVTLSDYQERDFGQKYGFLIDELKLLARGIIIIDQSNQVRYVEYVPEVTNHPDYDKALTAVKALVN